ncbi:MAG: PIG-L deacetylase family protein [Candidatus Thorarchaeota archaeon]
MFVSVKKALVVSPHTDDAILGAGGFIYKLAKHGAHIDYMVFTTCGDSLIGTEFPNGQLAKEDRKAASFLGASRIIYHDFENKHLQKSRQEILDLMYPYRNDPQLDLVLAPYPGDIHQDHRTVAEEAVRAFTRNHVSLLQYPILGTCKDFNPNLYIPLSEEEADTKIKALSEYKTQMKLRGTWFNPDRFWASLKHDGVYVNTSFAEAFMLAKGTWNTSSQRDR